MVTIQFVFGSLLVAEPRSEEKVKTHGRGQPDQRTTTHTQAGGRKKPMGTCVKKWIEQTEPTIACTLLSYHLHCMGARKAVRDGHRFPLKRKRGIPRPMPIKRAGEL